MLSIKSFLLLLKESFRDLLPIILVILFFQLAIIQTIPAGWMATSIGLAIVGVGLAVFLLGLEVAIFPVGENLASDFAHKGSTFWILIFAFLIGFGTTIAEPALYVIAQKAAAISSGRIDADVLRGVVAFSVGFAIVLGAWRIITGHPIQYYIIAGYILVVATTAFAPQEIVGLAYDLGGVTTSTVTVPLVAALGIGLASTIKGRNPVLDGFGLIAFASLTPMIFVQVYGIVVYQLIDVAAVTVEVIAAPEAKAVVDHSLYGMFMGLVGVVKDVVPILAIIAFFQYVVLKKPIEDLKNVIIGFGLVIIGLYAFILGLEMGLFSLGETMAYQLTRDDSHFIIYAFGFAIGLERLLALLRAGDAEIPVTHPHVYLVLNGQQAVQHGMVFAEQLRTALPGLRLQSNCGNGSFKSQFKRADRSGAGFALVMGDDEVSQGTVILKPLRSEAEQETLLQQDVAARIGAVITAEEF